jgi:hypothetical protein
MFAATWKQFADGDDDNVNDDDGDNAGGAAHSVSRSHCVNRLLMAFVDNHCLR